jgi:alpha-tubulin suppressor-like RCC1 family protein
VNAVAAVTTGDTHACALADDGRVFCWGENDQGQLGDGTTTYRNFATVPVIGIEDARAIAAGIRFTCAALADGSVWCWGEDPGSNESSSVPFRVAGISDATAVAAGGAFACALRANQHVACWGINSLGQLGNGQFQFDSGNPTPQAVVGIDDAVEISAGWNHACVVRTDRSVWCWGGNGDGATGYGQLGDGTLANRASPVEVTNMTDAAHVEAGGWSTCATRTDGSTWCWGYGERGTLGDGNFTNSSVPVQAVGIDDARLLTLGDYTACVSRADNSVWCWGDTSWMPRNNELPGTPREGNKSPSIAVTALANDRYCLFIDGSGQTWWWGTGTNQAPEPWPVGP